MEVSGGGVYGATRPRVTVCNGVPVVVWSNMLTKKVYSSRMASGVFSPPVLVTPTGFEAFSADWSGAEIDSHGDTMFVTITDHNIPAPAYVVKSNDGGLTFGDTVRVPLVGNELPRFPTVEVMPDGNPMIAVMRFDSTFGNPVNVVSHSADGGASFAPYTNATGIIPGSPCDCCPISIVANDNVAAVLFRNNDGNIRDTWAALSYDNGDTFNESARVDSNNWMLMACPSSGPDAYIFGDTLVSVFMNGAGSSGNRVFIASMDHVTGQVQSQKPVSTTITNTNQNYPRIDGVGDTLGIVWKQQVNGESEVMFAHAFNGPNGIGTWIDTLTAAMSGSQVYPDIAYGDGKLHAVFEDQVSGNVYYISASLPAVPTSTAAVTSLNGLMVSMTGHDAFIGALKPVQGDCAVQLFDAGGRELLVKNISGSVLSNGFAIRVSQFPAGLYFLSITTNDQRFLQKISLSK
ncbi:MAG TPA: T9SS type A sorting domain-containing protein [Chitinophagales bacterium]|nr:T9SS type A sorting domain-containing protein [Chitinophagales bacterium]